MPAMYEALNKHSNDGKLSGLFKIDPFISKLHLYCSAMNFRKVLIIVVFLVNVAGEYEPFFYTKVLILRKGNILYIASLNSIVR